MHERTNFNVVFVLLDNTHGSKNWKEVGTFLVLCLLTISIQAKRCKMKWHPSLLFSIIVCVSRKSTQEQRHGARRRTKIQSPRQANKKKKSFEARNGMKQVFFSAFLSLTQTKSDPTERKKKLLVLHWTFCSRLKRLAKSSMYCVLYLKKKKKLNKY